MAALLTTISLAKKVRRRVLALAARLPDRLVEPLFEADRQVRGAFEDVFPPQTRERQAELIVADLYAKLEEIEKDAAALSRLGRATLKAFRETVVDLELLLLPERAKYFELLEVDRTDAPTKVKSRYRALARQHHPDLGGDETYMARLNRAYRNVLRMKGTRD